MSYVALGLTAVLMAGCSQGAAPEPTAEPGGDDEDFGGQTLTVTNFGGTWQENWQTAVVEPFEKKYNAKILTVEATGTALLAKIQAQKEDPVIDVWMGNAKTGEQLIKDGLTLEVTEEDIPNLKNVIPALRREGDPYISFASGPVGIVYNTDMITTPPTSYDDLFDPAYAGHVAMPSNETCCSYYYAIQETYRAGGDLDDLDPGWEKLEELKPNVMAFTSWAQLVTLLTSGQAWIAYAATDRTGTAIKEGAPLDVVLPEEGALVIVDAIGIVKGTKKERLAQLYINQVLSAESQNAFTSSAVLSPGVTDATTDPANLPFLGTTEYLEKSSENFPMDWKVITEREPEWVETFSRIVGG